MAALKKIWMLNIQDEYELRIDWDNDRHQAIKIRSLKPEDIIAAFKVAVHDLECEKNKKFI